MQKNSPQNVISAIPAIPAIFNGRRFHVYNDFIRREFGGRVQKVSVDAGFTCPNRDGGQKLSTANATNATNALFGMQQGLIGGCTFCNNDGFSPSYLKTERDVIKQLDIGIEFLARRYPDTRAYLAYLQSYSNTYDSLDHLKKLYATILAHPQISGLAIGTRPDCVPDETLDYLAELAQKYTLELEIGIESCNDKVLAKCQRGHNFACTEDAIWRAAKRGLFITGHLLIGLPEETPQSLIQGAKALAKLPINALKFHQLQIMAHTRLANEFLENPSAIALYSPAQYLEAAILILEHLPPAIKIQRLGSEVPPSVRVSPDWGMRAERYRPMLEEALEAKNTWQGIYFEAV